MQRPIQWTGRILRLLDQRALPTQEVFIDCTHWQAVADAITQMVVRGAPAIGITAAYGFVLGCRDLGTKATSDELTILKSGLLKTRPTAVNLAWALDRMAVLAESLPRDEHWVAQLDAEARLIEQEDREMCQAIGAYGSDFLGPRERVLTHCNTGALATGGDGTALSIIREMHRRHKLKTVFVDETRPYLQGSRLTAWELVSDGLPACLITDNMAAWMMKEGGVEAVVVGADRIAANGDVANKIGTYGLAIACHYHQVPFVVAAPTSTIDLTCTSGRDIEIELRPLDEVKFFNGQLIAPINVDAMNPSFDVTPCELITAIVTERGVIMRSAFMVDLAAHKHDAEFRGS